MHGLLPLVSEKKFSKTKCELTIKCTYRGSVAKSIDWTMGAKKAEFFSDEFSIFITVPRDKEGCCESN